MESEPAQSESADVLTRLRQQLILAQVRIMELEDARDDTAGRLEEVEALLKSAQNLADQKLEESAHLARVRSDLQAQFENLRHIQHITNQALNQTRIEYSALQTQAQGTETDLRKTQADLDSQYALVSRLNAEAAASAAREADLRASVAHLETELQTMKATRSWRWTQWLRNLGHGSSSSSA